MVRKNSWVTCRQASLESQELSMELDEIECSVSPTFTQKCEERAAEQEVAAAVAAAPAAAAAPASVAAPAKKRRRRSYDVVGGLGPLLR